MIELFQFAKNVFDNVIGKALCELARYFLYDQITYVRVGRSNFVESTSQIKINIINIK